MLQKFLSRVSVWILLSQIIWADNTDLRGFTRSGSYNLDVDSVIFYYSLYPEEIRLTPGWGGPTGTLDSFDFFGLSDRPEGVEAGYRINGTRMEPFRQSPLELGRWYRLRTGLEQDPPEIMFNIAGAGIQEKVDVSHGAFISVKPNPFSDEMHIRFFVDRPGQHTIEIWSVTGQRVRTLQVNTNNIGTVEVLWNGKDEIGNAVQPGVYFLSLRSEKIRITQKLIRH